MEINPQQIMVVAEQLLEQGWIKGQLRGSYNGFGEPGDGQDPDGVCVMGSLHTAVADCLAPQIEQVLTVLPEFQTLTAEERQRYVATFTRQQTSPLVQIFRARIEDVIGRTVECWNDAPERKKQEVLEAMRASLEIVTQECLQAWQAENVPEVVPVEVAK